MNTVRARVWRFRVEQGSRVVAKEVGEGDLPVDLARLVHINAMACDRRGVLDYRTKQLEVRLLVSYLNASSAWSPLRIDHRAFAASARHIRGFVCESSGLGVLTAAGETLFAWSDGAHALHSFDALPKPLLRQYANGGVRPDLLFHLPGGPVAGEARGRHRRAKVLLPAKPLAEQKSRLRELAAWSASHSDHVYFMSWVWIGRSGVAVDIFLPENMRWDSGLVTAWANEGASREWRFPLREERPSRGPRPRLAEESDTESFGGERLSVDQVPPIDEISIGPEEQAERILDGLYRSAPEPLSELAGVAVRGDWALADGLGSARYEVLLGVLAERLPRQMNVRDRFARAEGRFDACLDGRLLTIVRPVTATRPGWREVEQVLLGHS